MRWMAIFTTPACAHPRYLALAYITLVSAYLYLLNANAVIYTNSMAHDVYIFIDGAHRMVNGQLPHLDFTSGLGAANFYFATLLEPFAKHMYQAFLWQNSVYLCVFMVLTYYVSISRLTLLLSCLLLLYVIGLLAVPSNIGDGGDISTFAMFYNRFGWVALLLTFLLFIPGHGKAGHRYTYDVAATSFVLVFCFYLKITYFLAVLILLLAGLILFSATLKFRAAGVALVCGAIILLIERVLPGFTLAYFNDLAQMSNANGQVEFDVLDAVNDNIVAIAFVTLAYLLVSSNASLIPEGSVSKRFYLSLLYLLLCIFLIENNAQNHGLPALFALLCAYVMVCIGDGNATDDAQSDRYIRTEYKISGLYFLALLFSIPELFERNGSLDRFYRYGQNPELAAYTFDVPARLQGHMIDEGSAVLLTSNFQHEEAMLQLSLNDYRTLFGEKRPRQEIYQTEYAYTLANGSALLAEVIAVYGEGPVLTMDFANPFSYLLDLEPARGDYLWFHDNKNISHDSYPQAGKLLKHIEYIMEPRYAVSQSTYSLLARLYRNYIAENYTMIAENGLWVIWKQNAVPSPDNTAAAESS